jgi:hypothetical protein
MRDEPGIASQSQDSGCDHDDTGKHGEQEQRLGALIAAETRHRLTGCERCGGRGGDHHQLGAGGQATGQRSGEAGIQTVHRVDAHQNGGGHAIRHAADGAWHAGDHVLSEMPPLGLDRPAPGPQAGGDAPSTMLSARHIRHQDAQLIANAAAKPIVVVMPTSRPPYSYASGIIVVESMARIAPPANASTNAKTDGVEVDMSW